MKIALCLLAAILSVSMLAVPPRVSVRASTGSRFARITAIVQPRPEHRALIIHGAVFIANEQGEDVNVWERLSGVQLEGDKSRKQFVVEWPGVAPGRLHVTASVIGLCGSADAVSFVGF